MNSVQTKENRVFQTSKNNTSNAEIFDADSDTVIVDNSANCIVWKARESFVEGTYRTLTDTSIPMIDTAAGAGAPVGIGEVPIGWYDDSGQYHKFILTEVFHVPDSPVNIMGISAFSKIIGDYENKGTRINSSGIDLVFTWDNEKYKRTFTNSDASLPELVVNDGFSKYHWFCNFVERIQPIQKQCYHVAATKSAMKLYDVGEEVLYKNVDHVEHGVIDKITKERTNSLDLNYHVKFKDNRKVIATKDNLQGIDETDVATIPTKDEDYSEYQKCLTLKEIQMLKNPLPLTNLEREWKLMHDKLGHLPFGTMDRLVANNMLPSKFKKMKSKPIICPSCIFGRMRRRAWRSKSANSWKHIRNDEQKVPGAKVSTDQLVVAQPGLVPRISGRHTNSRICGATGFYDNYSGYSYSSLQTSLDGEQTLATKNSFESHAATCGVKILSFRADNGRFAEKSFLDSVKIAQQTIDFCAVGSYHQNGIYLKDTSKHCHLKHVPYCYM